eukprot:3940737-Rhodomonas_salina.1
MSSISARSAIPRRRKAAWRLETARCQSELIGCLLECWCPLRKRYLQYHEPLVVAQHCEAPYATSGPDHAVPKLDTTQYRSRIALSSSSTTALSAMACSKGIVLWLSYCGTKAYGARSVVPGIVSTSTPLLCASHAPGSSIC